MTPCQLLMQEGLKFLFTKLCNSLCCKSCHVCEYILLYMYNNSWCSIVPDIIIYIYHFQLHVFLSIFAVSASRLSPTGTAYSVKMK